MFPVHQDLQQEANGDTGLGGGQQYAAERNHEKDESGALPFVCAEPEHIEDKEGIEEYRVRQRMAPDGVEPLVFHGAGEGNGVQAVGFQQVDNQLSDGLVGQAFNNTADQQDRDDDVEQYNKPAGHFPAGSGIHGIQDQEQRQERLGNSNDFFVSLKGFIGDCHRNQKQAPAAEADQFRGAPAAYPEKGKRHRDKTEHIEIPVVFYHLFNEKGAKTDGQKENAEEAKQDNQQVQADAFFLPGSRAGCQRLPAPDQEPAYRCQSAGQERKQGKPKGRTDHKMMTSGNA